MSDNDLHSTEADGPEAADDLHVPMLFDVVAPGDRVRQSGGRLEPDREAEAALNARAVTRELAKQFKAELDRRLPAAMREANARIRRAVDEALLEAVRTRGRTKKEEA